MGGSHLRRRQAALPGVLHLRGRGGTRVRPASRCGTAPHLPAGDPGAAAPGAGARASPCEDPLACPCPPALHGCCNPPPHPPPPPHPTPPRCPCCAAARHHGRRKKLNFPEEHQAGARSLGGGSRCAAAASPLTLPSSGGSPPCGGGSGGQRNVLSHTVPELPAGEEAAEQQQQSDEQQQQQSGEQEGLRAASELPQQELQPPHTQQTVQQADRQPGPDGATQEDYAAGQGPAAAALAGAAAAIEARGDGGVAAASFPALSSEDQIAALALRTLANAVDSKTTADTSQQQEQQVQAPQEQLQAQQQGAGQLPPLSPGMAAAVAIAAQPRLPLLGIAGAVPGALAAAAPGSVAQPGAPEQAPLLPPPVLFGAAGSADTSQLAFAGFQEAAAPAKPFRVGGTLSAAEAVAAARRGESPAPPPTTGVSAQHRVCGSNRGVSAVSAVLPGHLLCWWTINHAKCMLCCHLHMPSQHAPPGCPASNTCPACSGPHCRASLAPLPPIPPALYPPHPCRPSQYNGVSWDKRKHRWFSQIQQHGKRHFLGYYDSEEGAARAYDRSAPGQHTPPTSSHPESAHPRAACIP